MADSNVNDWLYTSARTHADCYDNDVFVDTYDDIYGGELNDLDFWRDIAAQSASPVLELACGTGRVTLPIADSGRSVLALDRSVAMLRRLQQKLDAYPRGRVEVRQGDIRSLGLERKFDVIILPTKSFNHLETFDDALQFLRALRRHMHRGSIFAFDAINPQINRLGPHQASPPRTFRRESGNGYVQQWETSEYLPLTQTLHITDHIALLDERKREQSGPFSLKWTSRVFFPQELRLVLNVAGFEVIEEFGCYSRSVLRSDSLEQVMISRLAGEGG